MRCRVEVGLFILTLAFIVSFWGGLGINIDLGEQRIVFSLEANPDHYWYYIRDVFLFLILPPAVGLAYSTIAFVREKKSPTGVLKWWLPLTIAGCFFFVWGALCLRFTYACYLDAIDGANALNTSMEIANLISKVCVAAMVGGILWLFAGLLFMLSPIFKKMLKETEAPQQIKLRFSCGKGVTTCLLKVKTL